MEGALISNFLFACPPEFFGSFYRIIMIDCREELRTGIRNIPWIDAIPVPGLNVYSILRRDYLVMSKDAVDATVERLRRPMKPCSLTP